MPFLDFSVEIASKYTCIEAKKICNEMIRDQSFDIKNADSENHRIIFAKKKSNILFINSFLPVVRIDFCENNCGSRISVNFQLRSAVKIILCIYTIVAIIFEVCLINLYMQNDLDSPVILLLPLLLVSYALVLSYFGLRAMSNPIKNVLVSLLGGQTNY